MKLSLIVAMSENRVIGCGGRLPWRLSSDLRRFKQLTMGHHLVMGRKTFESIGRPLPGRTSLVLSRQAGYHAPGATVVPDLQRACQLAAGDDQVFVIGGGEIFRQVLGMADRIFMTLVHARVDGDVTFPDLPEGAWYVCECSARQPADQRNDHDYTFLRYESLRKM